MQLLACSCCCFCLLITAAHSVISHIWGVNGGPARYAIHFGYPVGSILGPLIAMPFVSGVARQMTNQDVMLNSSVPATTNYQFDLNSNGSDVPNLTTYAAVLVPVDATTETTDQSSIEYAYLIVGAIIVLNSLTFVFMHFYAKQPSPKGLTLGVGGVKSFREVLSPSKWADGDGRFGVTILVLVMLYYILQMACMKGTQEYLVTYAVDSKLFTNQRAAVLNSVVYGAGAFHVL